MSVRFLCTTERSLRNGMTLTEMLVATTMTLVIMGVVVQLFGMVGNGVTASRASLEMSSELRSVAHALRTDLNGSTVETVPPVNVAADSGYLEIIEGPSTDFYDSNNVLKTQALNGDTDDILMFTTQSLGKPFVGKFSNSIIESQYAEVMWFCQEASRQPVAGTTLYNLHRRQLLVMDYVGDGTGNDFWGTHSNSITTALPAAYGTYDLSMRREPSLNRTFPNGLADLTKRENRFLHSYRLPNLNFSGTVSNSRFPYDNVLTNISTASFDAASGRLGEDIVLSNVLAFDVRVFDPSAEVLNNASAGVAVVPGDPGYGAGVSFSPTIIEGAYVDLGHNAATGVFAAVSPKVGYKSNNSQRLTRTYDTWSDHYEFNGIDEDSQYGVDQKNNLIDDDSNGIIDDVDELETSPPYPVPLRGLEARIRIYDTSTRQVRQVTVRHTFVPH